MLGPCLLRPHGKCEIRVSRLMNPTVCGRWLSVWKPSLGRGRKRSNCVGTQELFADIVSVVLSRKLWADFWGRNRSLPLVGCGTLAKFLPLLSSLLLRDKDRPHLQARVGIQGANKGRCSTGVSYDHDGRCDWLFHPEEAPESTPGSSLGQVQDWRLQLNTRQSFKYSL